MCSMERAECGLVEVMGVVTDKDRSLAMVVWISSVTSLGFLLLTHLIFHPFVMLSASKSVLAMQKRIVTLVS